MEERNVGQLVFVGSQKELKIKENLFYLHDQNDIPLVETEMNTDDRPIIEFTSIFNIGNPNHDEELEKIKQEWSISIPEEEVILDIIVT